MAKGTRICKFCGKEYEYCHTQRPKDVQRWQDVACCIEHATEYFKLVEKSRSSAETKLTDVAVEEVEMAPITIEEVEVPIKKSFKKKIKEQQIEPSDVEI